MCQFVDRDLVTWRPKISSLPSFFKIMSVFLDLSTDDDDDDDEDSDEMDVEDESEVLQKMVEATKSRSK